MSQAWFHSFRAQPAREQSGRAPLPAPGYATDRRPVSALDSTEDGITALLSHGARQDVVSALRSLVFGAISACLLLSVALYNGFPTVYPDTASYLYTGKFGIALFPFRAPGYGVFAVLTSLGRSLWFAAIVQAAIVVFVLYEACKSLIGGDSRFRDHCLVGSAAFLSAFSSLSWETSLVMPDIFAGVAFLCLSVLAFNAQLSWLERIVLASILAVGVGGHVSLLPIAAVFLGAVVVARVAGWGPREAPSVKSALPWMLIPLLAAGLWNANLNRQMGLGFQLSPAGNDFLLGRLLNDGLAGDYLRANCATKRFVACQYLDDLPNTPEQLLFWHPLLRQMDANGTEARGIVRGTLAAYPLRFAWNSTIHTLRQVVQCRTGDEVRDLALHAVNANGPVIGQIFPRDVAAYSASKLIQGRLVGLTKIVAGVDLGVFALSAIGCLWLALLRRDEKWNWFFYSAVVFLFLNAAVCATFAGVYDRYQARVAWIMPLCFVMFVCRRLAEKQANCTQR